MNDIGEPVHGELIKDGDSSTLAVLTLYMSGTTTERTLGDDERLCITDVSIRNETGGDTFLVAGAAAAAGKYIFYGSVIAKDGVERHYTEPYACPLGVVPYFAGAGSNLNSCIIEGFITKT